MIGEGRGDAAFYADALFGGVPKGDECVFAVLVPGDAGKFFGLGLYIYRKIFFRKDVLG